MRRHSTSATVTSSVDSPPTPNTPASQSFISPSFPSPPTLSKYLCPFPACQLSFSRSHDLARHILTHTQERPYECARCGRRFARRDALRRHDKVKNGEIVCALEGRPKGSKKRMSV
ncbi:hypothetical protein BC832DRAFT_546536 [Gaertneriomyces semiglobifer]|nr:hypothetical protein BC832DRAFT_546536 [Gaertneriomyces semiglobifer]